MAARQRPEGAERPSPYRSPLPKDLEGPIAARPVAVDGEVVVEGRHPVDTEPLHDREARPVDDGEVLVGESRVDGEGRFEVDDPDRLDGRGAAAEGRPEPIGGPGSGR